MRYFYPSPAVPAPPTSILYVSNSVAPDMDELAHTVLECGGVSVPTTHRSQCSCGGSRMEWTWTTATESNMPNSPKLPNSVQEVFHEVSEPNPMGNAVTSEETHGMQEQLQQPPGQIQLIQLNSANRNITITL